jgi:hypothetical protein
MRELPSNTNVVRDEWGKPNGRNASGAP